MNQGQKNYCGVDTGFRQDDSLSSLLFNDVLNFVMRKDELAGVGIEWSAGRRLKYLVYADDMCFIAIDYENLSRMNQAVVRAAGKVGLRLNNRKSEIKKIRSAVTGQGVIEGETFHEVYKFT